MTQSEAVRSAADARYLTGVPVRLRTNFSWSFAGSAGYAASQWLILVLLAKLGSVEMVGQLSFALAVTAPIFLLTGLSLRNVQVTDVGGRYSFEDYVRTRLMTLPFAFVLTAGVLVVSGMSAMTSVVVLLIAVSKTVESMSDLYYGRLQRAERMARVGISLLLRGGLSAATVALALVLTGDIVWTVAALIGSWLLVLLLFDAKSGQDELLQRPSVARGPWQLHVRRLAGEALPLGGMAFLVSVTFMLPKYFVGTSLGEASLGAFAAMAYFTVAGATVVNAMCQSALPRLSKLHESGLEGEFQALMIRLLGIATMVGMASVLGVATLGEPILRIAYTEEVARHSRLFSIIMSGGALSYVGSILMIGVLAQRKFRPLLAAWIMIALSTAVLSVLGIQRWGLVGAAAVTLAVGALHVALGGFLLMSPVSVAPKAGRTRVRQ